MKFIHKHRPGRNVTKRGLDDNWQMPPKVDDQLIERPASSRKRLIIKISLIGLACLIGLVIIGGLIGYLYVKAAPLKGESGGRVNVLVLGVDKANHLSDTILLMSVDTAAHPAKLALISLPRDLYLAIPGFGKNRINAAYTLGESPNNHIAGGGPALAETTIKQDIGTPINYFIAIDFKGFQQLVDSVGGIDVNVKQTLTDATYPNADYSGYDPFYLSAGPHHLDGGLALKYVRCRKGTCGNDYGRNARQQEVLLDVKTKAIAKIKHNPFQIFKFWHIFQSNTDTDLGSTQLLKLGLILRSVKTSDINQQVISSQNLLAGSIIDGQQVLVPRSGNFSAIYDFIQNIFKK